MPGANGRRNKLWAVEGIGGATRMNAMLWNRDYAAWSELGLGDWTYAKMEPYFQGLKMPYAIQMQNSEVIEVIAFFHCAVPHTRVLPQQSWR
jgi:choline dehydrogenase-like flavoprotein